MANQKAILCLDIDGTLTNKEHKIHPNDVGLIHQFPDNIQPILATGRNLMSAKRILSINQVFKTAVIPMPCICMNGGASYLPGEELLIEHHFPEQTRKGLIALSQSFPEVYFGFETTSSSYLVNPSRTNHNNPDIHYLSPEDVSENSLPEKIVKVMAIEHDKNTLKEIEILGAEINAEMTYSLPYVIEFAPLGINKAVGLPPLLEALSLEDIPIYTAGDGQNDIGLFDFAVKSFAPSYAHPEILAKANHVIEQESEGMLKPVLDIILRDITRDDELSKSA